MMPWWMKFYVRKPIEGDGDDTGGAAGGGDDGDGGGGTDGAGSGDEGGVAGDGGDPGGGSGGAGGGGAGDAGDERKTGADLTDGMRAAIEQGLKDAQPDAGAGRGADGGDANQDGRAAAAGAGKAADKGKGTAAADGDGKTPGSGDSGEGKDAKQRKADDFQLTAEEKKALSPRAIGRFHELHKHAKTVEAEVERYRAENQTLQQARDTIVGLLEETQTSSEELAQYLDFNLMMKSGKWEDVLNVIEPIRAAALKNLGREAPGVDLLAEHKDLKQMVEDGDMTREAALEVVKARQLSGQHERSRQEHEARIRAQESQRAVQEQALTDIEAWNRKMAQTDRAFSQKAAILEPKLKGLMQRYPPNLWAQVIQDAYDAIVITPAPSSGSSGGTGGGRPSGDGTLRPRSGGRPGGASPSSMGDAIKQGLGY